MEKTASKTVWCGIVAAALLLLVVACAAFVPAQTAYADEVSSADEPEVASTIREKHITSASDFLALVALSREQDTSNWVVYLDNDIELGDSDMQTIVNHTVKHLSFGNSKYPFAGTFDGQGHTVSGLKYPNNVADPERDTGFFAETKGATIKNFLVKDADVWADFRGGIIVGKAVDTHIENVMVMESTLHVTCANNALNLITNAGFEGGIIAGELSNSTVYNCEVRGGRAVNNTTSGVQALGGEGLYMAAFAGYVDNSTIEYSRVTPTRNEDGSVAQRTDVTNKYDVAVGALGGNNVYASGFVGRMGGGAKVIDCFSTASCYSYAASYVGVVAVTLAWSGGLAGRIDKADGNVIERSQFAGDLSSRQYNPVAVIPIIQNDVNLGGIAGRASNGDATITDCYFKPSVSLSGSSQGTAANKKLYALADDKTASGESFGPWDDNRYVSRELWESHDFDFAGATTRATDNGSHVNKWTMDYALGMPVHGESVKATLDFPGAGAATIKATKLGVDQATSDPYNFAVSAVLAGTAQGLAEHDTAVTFAQQTNSKDASVTSDANEGYRFMGWFRERGVTVDTINEDTAWFDGKTDDVAIAAGKQVENNSAHAAQSEYVANNADDADGFADNDLFIASYEAQVLFHDVNGVVLTAETGAENTNTSADWYRYNASITPAIPQVKPASASATFIGWTTKANVADGSNGGYVGITSTDLAALKNAGQFVPVGQAIAVRGPADYYPVYSDYASNIITVCEGNELDTSDDASQRVGVAKTKVTSEASGASTEYAVQVLDADGKALSDDGALPDGYRFLGWYETKQVNGENVEVRVSRDSSYTLPASVDLTVPHTYTARFEYRVDYYGTTTRLEDCKLNNPFVKQNDDGTFSAISYASNWQRYKSAFVERKDAPLDSQDAFDSWHEGAGTVDHGKASKCSAAQVTSSKLITEPFAVHAHVTGDDTLYDIAITDDFPGAASLSNSGTPALSNFTVTADVNDGYKFLFWDYERSDMGTNSRGIEDGDDPSWNTGACLTTHQYVYTAHLVAAVWFYGKDGNVKDKNTNGRRYQEPLLAGGLHYYTYPFSGTESTKFHNSNKAPSDAAMAVDGYKFLGWITTAEVEKDSAVWNYIYDVSGDSFTTSDPSKAAPYLVTDDYTVTQAQDVYPVYAKYNINYDTNLHRAGFTGTDTVNAPNWQITPSVSEADGVSTASVNPDITTTVYKNGTEKYVLEKVELECPDGTIRHIYGSGDDGNTYAATIEAGGSYTFVAYYTPLAVVYHLNATDINGKVAQRGDTLGSLNGGIPKPTFDVGEIDAADGNAFHAFVGWTTDKPVGSAKYVIWSADTSLVSEATVVNDPMELFPVYRATAIVVQSNIDSVLSDPSQVRGLSRTTSGDQVSLWATAQEEVTGTDGVSYDFVGWSRDYVSNSSYTLITSEKDYVLEGSEPFAAGVTYTAVYKKSPWKVRYHDVDGDVIYEATIEQDSERATGAGFVHETEVPKVDADGNPVYDESGNQEVEAQTVAYDPDAYVDESEELASRATSQGGVYKEMFLEWQAVAADGSMTPWDTFKSESVSGDMDLYPKTFYVIAHDTSNGVADKTTNCTNRLKWQLDPKASGDVTDTSDEAPIKACFAGSFEGTQLTISVDRVEYDLAEDGTVESHQEKVDGKNVSLYSMGSGSGSFALEDRLATKTTGADGQGSGNAVFDFPATHTLTLVKQVSDPSAAGMTFRFVVTKAATDSAAAQTREVSVTVGDNPTTGSGGTPVYAGTVQIAVPSGSYTIAEDSAWAWRYSSSFSVAGAAFTPDRATLAVSAATSESDATVTCVNTRTRFTWIDGDARAKNVWKDGGVERVE